jgi:hypothetical protein
MDEGERVWEQRGRRPFGRFPRGPKFLPAVIACLVIVIAAVSIPIFTSSSGRPPSASPSTSPSTIASTTPTPTPSVETTQGPPIGVVVYAIAHGFQVDSVDAGGVRSPCFEGSSDLTIEQIVAGRVLFTDGDLFGSTLRCEKPSLLIARRFLSNTKIGRDDHIGCVSLSPDGKRIAFDFQPAKSGEGQAWVANADGSHPRRRGGQANCVNPIEWVDNSHYLGQEYSDVIPYAVDVSTGAVSFLRHGEAWLGALSPDGGTALYPVWTAGNFDAALLLDRRTGLTRRLDAGKDVSFGDIPSWTSSMWNPSGTRFVLQDQKSDYVVYSNRGTLVTSFTSPIAVKDGANFGWFDDTRVWVSGGRLVKIVDVHTGQTTINVDLANANETLGNPTLYVASENPGILQRERSLQRDPDPEITIARGIFARTAPGWRVLACRRCRSGPYVFGVQLMEASTQPNPCGPGQGFQFGWTPDSVSRVRSRLMHSWGADRPGHSDPNSSQFVVVEQKNLQLGNRQFVLLEASFYECADWVAIGRVGSRTIVIDLPIDGLSLPANKVVLDTLRFTG